MNYARLVKAFLVFACILAATSWAVAMPHDGQVVRGETYEGVIFTPSMLPLPTKSDPEPLVAAGLYAKYAAYWTPSPDLIHRAEVALAKVYAEAQSRLPPVHDREYYAPKYFSRDHRRELPPDFRTNFLYYMDPSAFTPRCKRQYVGVTAYGHRMLDMNFVLNLTFENSKFIGLYSWKSNWAYIDDAGTQIFYDLDTGTFYESDT